MNNFFIEEDNMNNNNNNKLFEGNLLNDSDNLSISSNEFNEIFLKKIIKQILNHLIRIQ